jgi:uncharacterized membrane protein YdjX (TVP38/TMEM64 family)
MLKLLPIFILVCLFIAFYYFKLYRYFTFDALKTHRDIWMNLLIKHRFRVTLFFILGYIIFVAISLPNAIFLTLLSGFLFGPVLGTIYVVFSATIGASILFLAAKTALHDFLYQKSHKKLDKFKEGFEQHEVNYLLFLRLIPIFPFWLVNIVPAFFNVGFWTFVWTTFVGSIPGTAIYVFLGNSLNVILARGERPDLNIIFHPMIITPLIGLGVLALVPILYRKLHRHGKH